MSEIPRNSKGEPLLFEIGSEEHRAYLKKEEEDAIAMERINAESLGVADEFEKYVSECKFREYLPILNYKKLLREKVITNRIYFVFGGIVGVFACYVYLEYLL